MQKANIAPRLSLAAAMLLLANTTLVHAQRVGIGTENPETDLHIRGGSNARLLIQNISGIGSSEVEIKSSNTVNQSLRIVHFNTNNAGTIAGIALSGATSMLTGVNAAGGLLLGTQSNVPLYWLTNNQRRLTLTEGGQLAIGGTAPHPSAILDVQGNAGGLLIPRVTTAQRNAIAAPADGLLVYNQSTSNLNLFKQGTGWAEMSTSSGDAWLTTGNFTAPAGAQLGTWNGEPLRFRVFDRNAGMLGFDAEANAFMGYASGNHTQATQANTAFGTSSLSSLTSGQRNTAVGTEAGFGITTGSRNVLVGRQAGWQSTTQNNLVAIGAQALYHAKGNDHIAIGDSAYFGAPTGTASSQNIAIGKRTLAAATTASGNIAIGRIAMANITSGVLNTVIGNAAFSGVAAVQGGQHNIAIGANAMIQANGGTFNIGMGNLSLRVNSGDFNIALGPGSLAENTTGGRNIAIGPLTLQASATGSQQIALGDSALYSYNGTGHGNLAIGTRAGWQINTGTDNTVVGHRALIQAMGSSRNTAVGTHAMANTLGGGSNTALGWGANIKGVSGQQSVAIGAEASAGNSASIAMGFTANATGTNSIAIGANASALANSVAIGADAAATDNFTMVLGSTAITSWRFGRSDNPADRALIVGTNSTNGNAAFLTKGGTWTNNSDVNLKEEIAPLNPHEILQKLANLPITRWKYKGTQEYHIGPMAQDFYAAFATGTDDKSISSIDPAGVALAAIQALMEKNKMLESEINQLKKLLENLVNGQ